MQKDSKTSLERMADKLTVPKSTVHYRIKRLEAEGIIEGYCAKVNAEKVGKSYRTVTLVRAKYGSGYHNKIGNMLAQIPGVWAVYFVYGDIDFIVLARSDGGENLMEKVEKMINTQEIERTSTQIVAKVIKEDPIIEL